MFRRTEANLCLAAALAASGAVCTQDRLPLSTPWTPVDAAGVTEVAGRLLAAGPDYKAAFHRDHVEFVPVLGPDAPRNLPLQLRLRAVGRRGTGLAPVGPGALHGATGTDTVRYVRTGGAAIGWRLEERYDVRPDGIEQSFRFETTPAGHGDLVVLVDLRTGLAVRETGPDRILLAAEGLGGVAIGAVTGIDADGQRAGGRLALRDGGVLEMSLPAEFVDAARAPIVLDPLISAVLPIARGGHDRNAAATWHEGLQRWLCTWETVVSSTDVDVRAQLLDASGTPVGRVLSVRTGTAVSSEKPKPLPLTSTGMIAVVFVENRELLAVPVDGVTGAVGGATRIATGLPIAGDFDGDGVVDGADFLVWRSGHGNIETASIGWSATGGITVLARGAFTPPTGMAVGSPCLSHVERGGGVVELLAVWDQAPIRGGDADIVAVRFDPALNVVGAPFGIATSAANERNPSVDGDGTAWLVAWEHTAPGAAEADLGFASLTPGTSAARYPVHYHMLSSRPGNQLDPEVGWLGESALIAFRDEVRPGSGVFRATLRSIEPFRCTDCEGTFALDTTARDGDRVRIATRLSGGGDRDTALVVWDAPGLRGNPRDVVGRMFEARDGDVLETVPGCGSVSLHTACARLGNRNFAVRMFDADPLARVWMIVSWRRINIPLGPCVLVADPFAGLVVDLGTTDPLGAAALPLPVPTDPAILLSPLWFQPIVQSSSSGTFLPRLSFHTSCSTP